MGAKIMFGTTQSAYCSTSASVENSGISWTYSDELIKDEISKQIAEQNETKIKFDEEFIRDQESFSHVKLFERNEFYDLEHFENQINTFCDELTEKGLKYQIEEIDLDHAIIIHEFKRE